MVFAAWGAHSFSWHYDMWCELARVLRDGGTAAFSIYSSFGLPKYPQLTPLIDGYLEWHRLRRLRHPGWLSTATDEPHGSIVPPPKGWDDLTQIFTGDYHLETPDPQPIIARRTMTWGGAGLRGHLRTFGVFPQNAVGNPDGDISTQFLRTLMVALGVPLGPEGEAQEVEVEWPVVHYLSRKELDPSIEKIDSGDLVGSAPVTDAEPKWIARSVSDIVQSAPRVSTHLKDLKDSLDEQVPCVGGTYLVKQEDLVIYYDVGSDVRRIDLGNATNDDLTSLATACDEATFGLGKDDVLDLSYRKAGKMDLAKFATRFDVGASGLIDIISPYMLQGENTDGKALRAELYMLNVYGLTQCPGSFFKSHKDTPRGDTMIGSLVVIFPTSHSGAALTFENGGTTWRFDSAAELVTVPASTPSIGYVAFYSDVTHAVEPVQTGYRLAEPDPVVEDTLRKLIADQLILPDGGFLAFGLTHQYPMPARPDGTYVDHKLQMPPSRLGPLLDLLKGSDARVRAAAERLGLETRLKIFYTGDGSDYPDMLADDILNTEDVNQALDDSVIDEMARMGGVPVKSERGDFEIPVEEYWDKAVEVHWVTQITELNSVKSAYIAYGNYAEIGYVYGNGALFVRLPAFGDGVRE
ncbi:hypothetical protein B0H19DRAFT_1072184 [Mycena capillaripes]|nr:hypothetical protein B0H19DRAFT_1072184 [Mycena capillaripes]